MFQYMYVYLMLICTPHTELDALGDDFLQDEDTSYLDDTINVPEAPTTIPGGTERTRVCLPHPLSSLLPTDTCTSCADKHQHAHVDLMFVFPPFHSQEGVTLDEFGLPSLQ